MIRQLITGFLAKEGAVSPMTHPGLEGDCAKCLANSGVNVPLAFNRDPEELDGVGGTTCLFHPRQAPAESASATTQHALAAGVC